MKTETMTEAQDKVKALVALKTTNEYTELEQLHNSGISPIKSNDLTGSLKGRSNIIAKVREILESSQKEVLVCTSAPDFEDKSRVLIPSLDRLNKANIKVRIALSGDLEKVKRLNVKHNLKAKHIDSPARFFIVDRKQALLMITPEHADEEMGIWLSSPYFTESLAHMVEGAFKNGNGLQ